MDVMSTAGEDMWVYEEFGIEAQVFFKDGKAYIPIFQAEQTGTGKFAQFLDILKKEITESIYVVNITNPLRSPTFYARVKRVVFPPVMRAIVTSICQSQNIFPRQCRGFLGDFFGRGVF